MSFLPIAINISDKPILIVGGGKVAFKKIEGLARYSNNITVIAPVICDEIKSLSWVKKKLQSYQSSDIDGFFLIFAATNCSELNEQIFKDGSSKNCLVNVVDNPQLSQFVSPAIYKNGDVSIAITSNGGNVKQSIACRDAINNLVDNGLLKL